MESLLSNLIIQGDDENLICLFTYLKETPFHEYLSYSKRIIKMMVDSIINPKIQLEILKVFTDLFFSETLTTEQLKLIPLGKIFNSKYALYSQFGQNSLIKSYYNYFYPKEGTAKYAVGDLIDYLHIEDEDNYIWTEGTVTQIDTYTNMYTIKLSYSINSGRPICVHERMDSFCIQPHMKFSENDPKWRSGLASGDIVDFLDNEYNWYKVVINHRSDYHFDLGKRLMKEKDVKLSYYSQQAFGYSDINSIKIRPKDSFSFDLRFPELIHGNPQVNRKHNQHSMHIPYEDKHFVIPKYYREYYKKYSIEYCVIGNYFIQKLLEAQSSEDGRLFSSKESFEHFELMCNIIHSLHEQFHLKFARTFISCFIEKSLSYLLALSKTNMANIEQLSIDSILTVLRSIAEMGYYEYEIDVVFHKYELEFAINCLQKPLMDNKLNGLNLLTRQLKKMQYDLFQTEKTSILTQQAKEFNWSQIISLLFSSNLSKDSIKRTTDLLKQLIKTKVISKDHMIQILQLAIKSQDAAILQSVYDIFSKHTYEIGHENVKDIITHLIQSFNPETISADEGDLLVRLSQGINSFNNPSLNTVLDFFFDLIIKYHKRDYMHKFIELIMTKHMWDEMTQLLLKYIRKITDLLCLEELFDQLKFLFFLINSVPKIIEDDIRPQLTQLVFKNNQAKVSKLIIDFSKDVSEEKMKILTVLLDILQATRNSSEFLSNNNLIEELFGAFVGSSAVKRIYFFNWLNVILEKKLMPVKSLGMLFTLFDSFMNSQHELFTPYLELISFYWNLFLQINDLNKKHLTFNSISPFELKHSRSIWNMTVNFNEKGDFYLRFIDLFTLPYMSQADRSGIWKKQIEEILSAMTPLNKKNCIKSILALIQVSEYYGTANCIPHSFSFETSELTITVVNSLKKNIDCQFPMTLPMNMTFYEFKQLLSQKIDVNYHCFSVYSSPRVETEFSSKLNGQSLGALLLNDNIHTVYIMKSQDLDLIPQERLTVDPWTYTPEARGVFIDVFTLYSTNGKMSREQCAEVITIALKSCQMLSVEHPNVTLIFHKYDTDRDNLITVDDFLSIYLETIRDNGEDIVWQYLKNFNYRNDLRKTTDPLKKEPFMNEDPKLMPKYFLSQDDNYFQVLFKFQKESDTKIAKNATRIINMIETNKGMYDEILANCLNAYLAKVNDDYYNTVYSMKIMTSIFNHSDREKEANCMQRFVFQADSKSSLQLLLEVFTAQMNKLIYVPLKKKTLYLFELQLILHSLLWLINNKGLRELLQHYSHDKESDIKKIETEKVSLIIQSNSSLLLDKVIKVIGGNLLMISTEHFQLDMKMDIIKASFQILLIGLLVYGEKKMNSFMGIEFKHFLMNQFKIQFPYLQKLAYKSIKIIFAQYQQDLPFLKSVETIVVKEFREIMSEDREKEYDPSFLIKVYQDILRLTEFNKEERAVVIDEFVSLANTSNTSQERILIGYFTILNTLIESNIETHSTENILSIVLDKFLFGLKSSNLNFWSDTFIQSLFNLLSLFITKSPDNLLLFYSHDRVKSLFNHITMLDPEKRFYNPKEELREKIGYIGIKNLSAICYMNSVLQQLFLVKPFSYGINEIPKPAEPDNVLYQLQRMFSYLELSNRKEYSPEEFVYSFKDINGKPTDFRDQCDAQEFLSRFLEQIENSLKTTHLKYLLSGIFGGESCSQLQCLNSACNKISNRFEHLYYFSLDVKSVTTLEESLSKFILEEKIDDFGCEKCHTKGEHSKRVSFNRLPNVLIIHLQRFNFNFHLSENEKLDSRLTFPKQLNLKPYCTETLQAVPINDDEFNANVYTKETDYYLFKLVGVIIHSGTGTYGHYYSLINTARDELWENWVKFNDGSVGEYLIGHLEEDAFGGENLMRNEWTIESNQSAYMLVYERIKKTNLSLVVDKEIAKDSVIELKDKAKMMKLIDSTISIEMKEKSYKSDIELIEAQYSHVPKYYTYKGGDSTNSNTNPPQKEYLEILSYEAYCKRVSNKETHKRLFYDEVKNDNIKLINDRKIYSLPFCKLLAQSVQLMINFEDLSEKTIITLYKTIHSLVLSVIAKSYYKDNIVQIVTDLIQIMKLHPPLIEFLLEELCSKDSLYLSYYIFTPDTLVGEAFSLYIAEILISAISSNIKQEEALKFIDELLGYFPMKLIKKWSQMVHFLEIFNHLSKSNNEQIIKYLLGQETILKMCEIFLGKDYPYYKGIKGLDSSNQSSPGKFSPLISTIANILTFSPLLAPTKEEQKCLTCSQFSQKALSNNYDVESLTKIISLYKKSDKAYMSTSSKDIIKVVNKVNDLEDIKKAFNLVKEMFAQSDESTEICLQNFIGIMQFTPNEKRLRYMSPLENDTETIVTKVLNSVDRPYFFELVELFYELLVLNPQIPRYIGSLLPTCGADIKYGLLQEIDELYDRELKRNGDKSDDKEYQARLDNIERMQTELRKSLELENNEIGNMNIEITHFKMNIIKESINTIENAIFTSDSINSHIKVVRSIIELNILADYMMEEKPFHFGSRINLYESFYYIQNLSQMYHGTIIHREDPVEYEGLKCSIVRYAIVNIHFNSKITLGITFTGNALSKFPQKEMIIFMPIRSIKEIIVLRKEDDTPATITIREIGAGNPINISSRNEYKPIQKSVSFDDSFPVNPVSNLYVNSTVCSVCDTTNYISETETEFKCTRCTALLFQ